MGVPLNRSGVDQEFVRLDIQAIGADSLSLGQLEAWRRIQRSVPRLSSPYFCPEFTQAVSRAGGRVEVAVISDGGRPVGFFPYERTVEGDGLPPAAPMNDFQGLIIEPGQPVDPLRILHASGLRSFTFTHLEASGSHLRAYQRSWEPSPFLDLSRGFDQWAATRPQAGRRPLSGMATLERKLEREVGPVRFEASLADQGLLATLLDWKSRQFLRSGLPNLFAEARPRSLLSEIHRGRGPQFAGMLSGLWAGPTLIALHFGMRSATVWHYWFPAYLPEFSRYSPGLLLLLRMARAAQGLGLQAIDLGFGWAPYKDRFMSGSTVVAGGCIQLTPPDWTRLEVAALACEGAQLSKRLSSARQELETLRRSRSWRVASPLRHLYDVWKQSDR